ncbi:MAG: TIGR03067 domain-containing protein [Casimicrobiaceae bacterium]
MHARHLLPMLLLAASTFAFAQAKTDNDPDEVKKFQGTWVMVEGTRDGKPVAAEHVGKSKIVWSGNDTYIESPHQTKDPIKSKSTVKAAVGGKGAIDFTRATGPDAGKQMLAIYEFRGPDVYVTAFAVPGQPRPTEFSSKPGSGHSLHVWKRVKT